MTLDHTSGSRDIALHTRRPESGCATCNDSGKTPCALSMTGTNDRPARVSYGPCPVCRDGNTCPRCFHQGGIDENDNGDPKCRFCGWSAEGDRQYEAGIPR